MRKLTIKLVKQSYPPRRWKEEEDDILRKMYYDILREDIMAHLPNRKWEAIRQRALKLNLSRSSKFLNTAKDLWKNEEYRRKMTILRKESYEKNKEKYDKNLRRGIECQKKHGNEIHAKRMLNPEYKKRWNEGHKRMINSKENIEHLRNLSRSEEGRERSSIKMKTRWLDPAWRQINAKLWADPEFRKKNARGIAKAAREGSKIEKHVYNYFSQALAGKEVKHSDWSVLKNQEIDISIPSLKVAIEVQGPAHFFPFYGEKKLKQRQEGDNRKYERLEKLGWKLYCVGAAMQISRQQVESQCDVIIRELLGFENWKPPQKKLAE